MRLWSVLTKYRGGALAASSDGKWSGKGFRQRLNPWSDNDLLHGMEELRGSIPLSSTQALLTAPCQAKEDLTSVASEEVGVGAAERRLLNLCHGVAGERLGEHVMLRMLEARQCG